MLPTLLGITFLVFMLIAMSPGGIGASLRRSGGGQMSATNAAIRQMYLEDRYGLDDPPVMQYFRWLGRISPVKFGQRDQITPKNERISLPRHIKAPVLWDWFTDSPPVAQHIESFSFKPDASAEDKAAIYRKAKEDYAKARSAFLTARAIYEQELGTYAQHVGINKPRNGKGKLREKAFRAVGKPDPSSPDYAALHDAAQAMFDTWQQAENARARFIEVFKAKPYPEAGIPIVPGMISLAMPDFGVSFTKSRPVVELIKDALPVTLLLNLVAFPVIYFISIPVGMLSAVKRGSSFDSISGVIFIALWSFPTVLAGVLAIGFLASNQYLGWFPVSGLHDKLADTMTWLPTHDLQGHWQPGYVLDTLWHICLPVLCLVYGGFAVLSKQTRAAMLDNFNADYVRTAKAKGVPEKDIIFRHVFRNSLLPLITMFVTLFPALLSGSVIIESIFSVPGMGHLAIDAINNRDRELVLATTLMIGAVNLLALLLADILYAMADPRITYE